MCCRGSAARHRGPRSPRRRSLRHLRAGGRWQRAACRCSGSAFCAPTPAEVRYAVRQRPPDAAKHPVERSTSCPSRPWRARQSRTRAKVRFVFVRWAPRRCVSDQSLSLLQSNLLTTGPDRRGSSRRRTTARGSHSTRQQLDSSGLGCAAAATIPSHVHIHNVSCAACVGARVRERVGSLRAPYAPGT